MLDRVVRHLHSHNVPFRLESYPAPEQLPEVAHKLPPGGLLVRTQVALVGRTATILCVTAGAEIDYPALQRELNAPVVEGSTADLPAPYTGAPGHVPPIGGPAGVLVVIDEQVTRAGVVVFRAFAPTAFMEIRYEELSRLETPRIAAFAVGGMLPEHGSP